MQCRLGTRRIVSKLYASQSPYSHDILFRSYAASSSQRSSSPRRLRLLALTTGTLGALALWDHYLNARTLARSARTAWTGLVIALDYKWSFRPGNADQINALHERVAWRIHDLCEGNGGLYIKLGQSLGIQAAVLPKPYREAFRNLYDRAPFVGFDQIKAVFESEFGGRVTLEDAFDYFDPEPLASASLAQVHKARLKGAKEDEWVAVKIQKPEIAKQVGLDLRMYKMLLWVYERIFDIPIYFTADFTAKNLLLETDFSHEAENASRTAGLLAKEPEFAESVYIPKIHWPLTAKRVMTAEFIEGCRINEKEKIEKMGLNVKQVMNTNIAVFAQMIFVSGWVHCDPHPGNIIIRQHPKNHREHQVVLIDHGLYIPLSHKFKQQYCDLWRSLFVMDTSKIDEICQDWGIADSNIFASATLLRPTTLRREKRQEQTQQAQNNVDEYEKQVGLRDRIKSFLAHQERIPLEIIFITRCMKMAQYNNQSLGSPSNRVNIFGRWAAIGLSRKPIIEESLPTSFKHSMLSSSDKRTSVGIMAWVREHWTSLRFRITLFTVDLGFRLNQMRQWIWGEQYGFENLLQDQVKKLAMDELGVELDDDAFSG